MYIHSLQGRDHAWLVDEAIELTEVIETHEGCKDFAVHKVSLKDGDYHLAVKTDKVDVNDKDKALEFARNLITNIDISLGTDLKTTHF